MWSKLVWRPCSEPPERVDGYPREYCTIALLDVDACTFRRGYLNFSTWIPPPDRKGDVWCVEDRKGAVIRYLIVLSLRFEAASGSFFAHQLLNNLDDVCLPRTGIGCRLWREADFDDDSTCRCWIVLSMLDCLVHVGLDCLVNVGLHCPCWIALSCPCWIALSCWTRG